MARVFIGIPMLGDVPPQAIPSHMMLTGLIARKHNVFVPEVIGMRPLSWARDHVMHMAKKCEADYVLFVDDDIVVSPEAFDQLLETMTATGAAAVTGWFCRREFPFDCVWSKVGPDGEMYRVDAGPLVGPTPIDGTGMGIILIDMAWMNEHAADYKFWLGQGPDGELICEDQHFAMMLSVKGGKLIGDPRVRGAHIGQRIRIDDDSAEMLRRLHIQKGLHKDVELQAKRSTKPVKGKQEIAAY